MGLVDAISFGLSIGMGFLSIGLGIFSIWLSYRLSESSARALSEVKELSRETRTLVDVNLSQQKDFSSKMLDSILENNKFGSGKDSVEMIETPLVNDLIKTTLEEFEGRLSTSVEQTVRGLFKGTGESKELRSAIESIKKDISRLSEAAPEISEAVNAPEKLRAALNSFRKWPAHYVVLAAILDSGARGDREFRDIAEEYYVPAGWESGIGKLIASGVLEGSRKGFNIPDQFEIPLQLWWQRNKPLIEELQELYKSKKKKGITPEEVKIGSKIEN